MKKNNLLTFMFVALVSTPVSGAEDLATLKSLSLEELLQIKVTTASKSGRNVEDIAAAVYVLTSEDIRRSGATSIPEVLRSVPGLNVANLDANKHAVSSRGFNDLFANKMLVMIDGRSIYDPVQSGVFWADYGLVMDDIERIEIVRGPGASLWGANAVNGVINIINKNSADTQGLQIATGMGSPEKSITSVRYGDRINDDVTYRLSAKYSDRDGFDSYDEHQYSRLDGRLDWRMNDSTSLNLSASLYKGDEGQRTLVPIDQIDPRDQTGGHVQLNLQKQFSADSNYQLQFYYSRNDKDKSVIDQVTESWDMDLQYNHRPVDNHYVSWGLGYRLYQDELLNRTDIIVFIPDSKDSEVVSAFVQDEISLLDDAVIFVLGSKFEDNDFSGFEFQPSARLLWHVTDRHSVWASVSRAVRTPSRADHDLSFDRGVVATFPLAPLPLPDGTITSTLAADGTFESEEVVSYEMGYRFFDQVNFTLDAAAFFNNYDKLRSNELGDPQVTSFIDLGPPFGMVPTSFNIPATLGNRSKGETYGVEISTQWQVNNDWKLIGNYSWLDIDLEDNDSADPNIVVEQYLAPDHHFSISSYYDLTDTLELDAHWFFVDELPDPAGTIESYHRLDLRLGWHPNDMFELSLVGRNLLDQKHFESPTSLINPVIEVEPSYFVKATFRY